MERPGPRERLKSTEAKERITKTILRLLRRQLSLDDVQAIIPKDDRSLPHGERRELRFQISDLRREHTSSESEDSFPSWYILEKAGLQSNVEARVEEILKVLEAQEHTILSVEVSDLEEAFGPGTFLLSMQTYNEETKRPNKGASVPGNGTYKIGLEVLSDSIERPEVTLNLTLLHGHAWGAKILGIVRSRVEVEKRQLQGELRKALGSEPYSTPELKD